MGKSSVETKGPDNFIDYSFFKNKDSDLEDLVLIKYCSGLISSGEGISAVANVMKKPVLYLGHSPYEVFCTFSAINWIVPAIYINSDGNVISLKDAMMSSELMLDNNLIKKRNYKIKEISEEEVYIYCKEFFEYLKKINLKAEINSNKICNLFWNEYENSISKEYKVFHKNIKANIPIYFLNKYGCDLLSKSKKSK